jgi:acyl-CoA thioesterase I
MQDPIAFPAPGMLPALGQRLLVCVYGDSLSLPRFDEGVPFFRTYPELLREEWERLRPPLSVHIYNRSRSAAIIPDLFADYSTDMSYFGGGGDILIIQCGICDCAPRPIPDWLRRIIGHLPAPARLRIIRVLHENRARILEAGSVWRRTSPIVFASLYRRWLSRASREFRRVYAINIAPTTTAMEEHSPTLEQSIEQYNDLIADAVRFVGAANVHLIDVSDAIRETPGGIMSYVNPHDGHHITPEGHALYGSLISTIEKTGAEGHQPGGGR